MQPRTSLPILGALLAVVAAGAAVSSSAAPSAAQRTFRLTYTTRVKDVRSGSVDVWVPYPISDANQSVHQVRVEAPGPVTISALPGGAGSVLHYRGVPTGAPIEISLEALVTRRENAGRAEKLTPSDRSEYLKAEPLVPLDGPVLALAREAVRGKRTTAEKARAIYDKVTTMMRYDKSGTGWGRGDALYACDAKAGNCTDFHALIIGMARSQGIPARFAIGFSIPPARGTGEIPGYHCWAELYVDGVWIPIDSSEASKALAAGRPELKEYYYGHHDPDRVELSRGRHLTLTPRQTAAPLNFFVYPHVEADGKPVTSVERQVRYTDLPGAP